jgi:hypothetical protein
MALSFLLIFDKVGWNFLHGSLSGGGLNIFLCTGGVSILSASISLSVLSSRFCSLSSVTCISGTFRLSSSVIETRGCASICCLDRCLLRRCLISSFSSVFRHGTLSLVCGCTSAKSLINLVELLITESNF